MAESVLGVVSPRHHMSATVELDRSASEKHVATTSDGRRQLLDDYLSRHRPSAFIRGPSDLAKELGVLQGHTHTLDFALMLFDPQLSKGLKQRASAELDGLLESNENRDYALDVILSAPLSARADVATAKSSTASHQRVQDFVGCILGSQERSRWVLASWFAITSETMVQQMGVEEVRGILIHAGVIRRLVLEGKTQADLQRISGSVAITGGQSVALIVKSLMNEYRERLPVGKREKRVQRYEKPSSGDYTQTGKQTLPDRKQSWVLQDQAVREVEEIAKLYVKGDDDKASKFKDELVARQTEDQTDRSFLVKSLCNIASKCSAGGRRDIAAECLELAARNPQGCDYRLFVQMGDLFKDLHKYDAATDCFRKAEVKAANGDERNDVNRELARLLTARGDYEEALESFERLSDIGQSKRSRTSMATLLRKMGRLDEARSTYESVATWPPKGLTKNHQALAGLAETNRQTGRYQKAIKKYEWLAVLPDLNERTTKVYRTALSSLYRLTGQLSKSESTLRDLLNVHPLDSSIQLELAKVLQLLGKTETAKEYFQNSQHHLWQTDVLAAKLYATAMGEPFALGAGSKKARVLPEFEGLSRCHFSMQKILEDDFEGVLNQPQINHAFRLHRDFESVLKYHARRALDASVSRVIDVSVNIIRKRGLLDLKEAVIAIDDGDLGSALEHEKRLCLLAA